MGESLRYELYNIPFEDAQVCVICPIAKERLSVWVMASSWKPPYLSFMIEETER